MKSTFKSAAGALSQFFIDVVNEVQEEIGERADEAIERAFKSRAFVRDTAKRIIASARDNTKGTLHIVASLSLADRIAWGEYDWVNSDITEEHFPTNISSDYDAEYKLFHFNRTISSEDTIKEMERERYRPGTLVELLALGEAQPELQKQFPIVALGSAWQDPHDSLLVPVLSWVGTRKLHLYWFENVWRADYHFLAVRK